MVRVARLAKDRDADRTRSLILDAAERIFARDGLRAARTLDIASQCHVTKAMIHYYFGTKEKLYQAVLDRVFLERIEGMQLASLRALPPRDALDAYISRLFGQMARKPHLGPLFALENIQNDGIYYTRSGGEVYRVLTNIVDRGMAAGVFRAMDSRHAAIIIMGACVHYFNVANNVRILWPERRHFDERLLREHIASATDFVSSALLMRRVRPRTAVHR
jgi:TetR/AcrR family transcriptional regulator